MQISLPQHKHHYHFNPSKRNQISTRKHHNPSQISTMTCKILVNPYKKTLPRTQSPSSSKPRTIPPHIISIPPQECSLNPVQKLASLALDMLETFIIKLEKTRKSNTMVDPKVQLDGNYAPVQECPVRHDLKVTGKIPKALNGVYLRNGGNPLLYPTSGHHFFDGDGMIHAVSFSSENNKATYACRFTRTNRLVHEARLGRQVFPKPIGELHGGLGLARLVLYGARILFGLVDAARGLGVANAGLVYFNQRVLAMSEDDLPYSVRVGEDYDLETVERYDFDGQLKDSMIAHPKIDPDTGDLLTLNYNVLLKPYLKFIKFNKSGNKSREVAIALKRPTMIHDFAITQNHVIIPDHQIVFDLSQMIRGGSPVIHDRNKISRFGVMRKDAKGDSEIQWIEVPDCFCFHMWNAWEEYNEHGEKIIVVINSCMTPPDSIFSGEDVELLRSELTEIRLNLCKNESTRRVLVSGMNLDAGQVCNELLGKKTKYLYMAIADPWPRCSGIAKVDLETGNVTNYFYGGRRYGGEPCFVAAKVEEEEEREGFLMSHVRDEEREESELVILRASDMFELAKVKIPTRVPYGFHGIFVSREDLKSQYAT